MKTETLALMGVDEQSGMTGFGLLDASGTPTLGLLRIPLEEWEDMGSPQRVVVTIDSEGSAGKAAVVEPKTPPKKVAAKKAPVKKATPPVAQKVAAKRTAKKAVAK